VRKKGLRDPLESPFHPSLILSIHPLILLVPTLLLFHQASLYRNTYTNHPSIPCLQMPAGRLPTSELDRH